MSDISLPSGSAYLEALVTARRIMDETGLTLAEVAALDLDEFARLAGRPTPAQAALTALSQSAQETRSALPSTDDTPVSTYVPDSPSGPQRTDINSIDWSKVSVTEYARIREHLGIAEKSNEGMIRHRGFARVYSQNEIPESGRKTIGRWQG